MLWKKRKVNKLRSHSYRRKERAAMRKVCYDSSYASMLIAMLMTMLMTMFLAIADRSSLDYRVVSKSTLFRVSLCSSESYR